MTAPIVSSARRFSRRAFVAAACAAPLTAHAAAEQGKAGNDAGGTATAPDAYIGVAPGSANKNPLPRPDTAAPKLVWTGFQPSAEGGRVFLQTTLEVAFDFQPRGKQLSLTLRNCRIHLKNNERDLDTSFFETPVAGVKARQRRKDVEVQIALKQPAETAPRLEDGPDGTKFLVLDFVAAKA